MENISDRWTFNHNTLTDVDSVISVLYWSETTKVLPSGRSQVIPATTEPLTSLPLMPWIQPVPFVFVGNPRLSLEFVSLSNFSEFTVLQISIPHCCQKMNKKMGAKKGMLGKQINQILSSGSKKVKNTEGKYCHHCPNMLDQTEKLLLLLFFLGFFFFGKCYWRRFFYELCSLFHNISYFWNVTYFEIVLKTVYGKKERTCFFHCKNRVWGSIPEVSFLHCLASVNPCKALI